MTQVQTNICHDLPYGFPVEPTSPLCVTRIHELATTLSNALDAKDYTTCDHSRQAADLSAMLACKLNLTQQQVDLVHIAAHLHDIGKIGIPDSILKKPGPLTDDEWEVIRQHPGIGANIVAPISVFNTQNGIKDIVLCHHERYDGRGYPEGLQGEAIPLGARIVALADAFSAMLQERPYKSRLTFEQAQEEVRAHTGTQFCPLVSQIFEQTQPLIRKYYHGWADVAQAFTSF